MLASSPLPLDLGAAVAAAMARAPHMRLDVRWFPQVSSTMDVAGEAVQTGAGEGLVIVADEQIAGRGRRGRAWSSPPGAGLYLSMVLRPPLDTPSGRLALLTLAAGVAVRAAIAEAAGVAADLKWPNDVMVGRRKLAGILAEGSALGTSAQAIVLGIGINLHAVHVPALADRAIALDEIGAPRVDRAALLEALLVALPAHYDRLRRGEVDDILRAWRAASPSAHDAPVAWNTPAGPREGVTAGIDDTGALLIRTAAGVDRFVAGELQWR